MGGHVIAVVPAAGAGLRFGPGADKPFAPLLGKPLIVWALQSLQAAEEVSEIIPVLRPPDVGRGLETVKAFGLFKVKKIAEGGPERQDSVFNGLRLIDEPEAIVLIHDGARPLLERALIQIVLRGLEGHDGAVAALPPKDTIKETDVDGIVVRTPQRGSLRAAQTPQVFRFKTLIAAYMKAAEDNFCSTDDSALVERIGGRVKAVPGSYKNIKITTPEDLDIAALLLEKEAGVR